MRCDFLTPDDDRWAAFLRDTPHDFYHLPGYVRLTAAQGAGRAEAVLITGPDDYFFLPYLIRPLPTAGGDLVSPYGYPGPLFREGTPGFLRAALGEWAGALRQRGIVSGFFRLHPLFPVPAEVLQAHGCLTHRGNTVSIDLTADEQAIWDGFRHGHQLDIKRARRRGLRCTMARGAGTLDEFVSIYRETMDRVGAADFYYFPRSYFEELHAVLGDDLWVCLVRGTDDEALAGSLLVRCGPILQYHLGGTRTAALPLAPIKLLHDFIWRQAKEAGGTVLHLGGGVGSAEDSLFQFKAGFSDRRHPYHTWQVIFLDDVYQALTARRLQAGSTAKPDYFPAYRA